MKNQQKSMLMLAMIATFFSSVSIIGNTAWANNLQVENVTLTDKNTTSDYVNIQFDISWDNSWNLAGSSTPFNWDAAWVFAKWKYTLGGHWNHCTLSTTVLHHTAPSGSQIDASFSKDDDGRGVFIYRSSTGTGANNWDSVKLRWNYGTDGVGDNDVVEIKVFAIEMVYIPTGAFYLGDGLSTGTFSQTGSNTTVQITTNPVVVKCEDTNYDDAQLEGSGILVDGDSGIDMDGTTTVDNPDYPTGYSAFYIMKYEISQGQYADFLNTLTSAQDGNRFPNRADYRHTIGGTYGSRSAGRPDRACNYLSWDDGCAYADWSSLRPMTELEFEKACRGILSSVSGEYAWGTTTIVPDVSLTLSGIEDGTETVTTDVSAGAAVYGYNLHIGGDGDLGPLRCGIFATATSNRVSAGASYYGVMEMSGNVIEKAVTLGNSAGRSFTGRHGNGAIDSNGDADVSNWPGSDAVGSGLRGGYWHNDTTYLHVSYRSYAASADGGGSYRGFHAGFRAARTP
jgi:formylglycine-generating enzyme required for sulfatase activity